MNARAVHFDNPKVITCGTNVSGKMLARRIKQRQEQRQAEKELQMIRTKWQPIVDAVVRGKK